MVSSWSFGSYLVKVELNRRTTTEYNGHLKFESDFINPTIDGASSLKVCKPEGLRRLRLKKIWVSDQMLLKSRFSINIDRCGPSNIQF